MMSAVNNYDIAVIGAGMVGAALAKYLVKENKALRVVLVGQSEQQNKFSTDIHGAHYDKGRVAPVIDPHPTWGIMGRRSIERFRDIEQESGISFYNEAGFLSAGRKDGEYISTSSASAEALNDEVTQLPRPELCKRYPYMAFDKNDIGLLSKRSGYIDPRKMVTAQIKLAEQNGCEAIDIVVDDIRPTSPNGYEILLADGRKVKSNKVILATGAFTFCRPLLPDNLVPKLCLYPNTVILVEIDEEARHAMKDMPPMVYKGGRFERTSLSFVAYILPPIQYEDGKYYIKLGHGFQIPKEKCLKTPQEVHAWYCKGRRMDIEADLIAIVRDLFPELKMENYHFRYCVTAWTPNRNPYISLINPTFGVALGACGIGAKCSDEMGLIAARLISKGYWDYDLPEEDFVFQSNNIASAASVVSKL